MAYFYLMICFLVVVLMLDRLIGVDPIGRAIRIVTAIFCLVFGILAILNILSRFNPFGIVIR